MKKLPFFYAFFVICVVISLLLTSGCAVTNQDTETDIEKNIKNDYLELTKLFDEDHPGRGPLDYGDYPIADNPKSYAMYLSAKLMEVSIFKDSSRFDAARKAGYWLLENSDLDKDGQIGWGLPVEWDAYGDGTINPANTVYTISTAIVINALQDWVEIDPDAPVDQINSAIERSLKPYIEDNKKNPEGLLPYSLSPFDESFHTYNPAAYLAGQMQRFSLQTTDPTLRKDLRVTSDHIISILIQSKQIDETGGWFWLYSTDEGYNSIAHAGYIADGIRNYIKYGGALTDQLDWPAVYKHFEHFFMEDGYSVSLMPHILELNASETARLYDLGFFMYLEGLCNPDSDRKDKLLLFSKSYRTSEGLYSIVPGSDVVINEYNSYLLYGWSSILSKDVNHTCLAPTGKSPQAFSLESTDLSQNIEVPFTFFNTKATP